MSAPKTDEAAIRAIIRALRAAGWELDSVNDGEELIETRTESDAIEAITAVDQANLYVVKTGRTGRVFFVLGNDPKEVACDYTTNLSDAIEPLTDTWWD